MSTTIRSLACALVCWGVACAGTTPAPSESPPPAPSPAPPASAAPVAIAAPATTQKPSFIPVDTDPEPNSGQQYKSDLDLLYVAAACGFGIEPKLSDPKAVEAHCKVMRPLMQGFRDKTMSKAVPFFAGIRPHDLPPAVVYPFGGGDLLWALIVFPDALEYTTISLEYAGDPRRFAKSSKQDLAKGFKLIEEAMGTQLRGGWNWTRNMEETQRAGVPDQLVYALGAMVIHGYEPLSLRFFAFRRDGTLDYLDVSEIEALADRRPEALRQWGAPDYSKAFSNAEIRFRKRDGGPVKVFRHVAANLSDNFITRDREHLTKDPSLIAHLESKGPVCALTRAASHLLWEPYFSVIRDYLAQNLVWMPSDSTGLPPPSATAAGLVQETYGVFSGAYEPSDQGSHPQYNADFVALFANHPPRPLEFLFGYPDQDKKPHLIITRRP
ncbi:MAG: hypothetical protein JW751_16775 [Polyangiaceae bacterium]|nr:hypothetical protein [Polyangiaceae bacterium]